MTKGNYRLIGWVVGFFLVSGANASAMTVLKQVQVSDGTRVDLLFDGKLAPGQITTEYFNDIVQINLNDVSVYPPKISTVTGPDLSKVFVYQYTPKLVRCRLTVKGKADGYQKRLQIKANGKMLTIRIVQAGSDHVTVSSAHQTAKVLPAAPPAPVPVNKSQDKNQDKNEDAEEQALLERVMKSQPSAPGAALAPMKNKESAKYLAGGKALPSMWRVFGMLIAVVGMFGLAVIILVKLKDSKLGGLFSGSLGKKSGMTGAIGRWARKSLGNNGKMIEVVATHYLGPKKSIVVVKVAGRMLVLGIANDSINLITQVAGQTSMDAIEDFDLDDKPSGVTSAGSGPDFFSDLLNSEAGKPSQPRLGPQTQGPSFVRDSIRTQIRSKMEGMKPI